MLPHRNKIKKELVAFLDSNGATQPCDCYEYLKKQLLISEYDLRLTTSDNKSLFEKEVRWAKKDLVDSGVIKKPIDSGRGIWDLSESEKEKTVIPVLCHTAEELDKAVEGLGKLAGVPKGQKKPSKSDSKTERYLRDAAVVAYVLQEAAGFCECCSELSPFKKKSGVYYLEVHHVKQLSDGGSDTIYNAIAACPNCHRELHYGVNSRDLLEKIYSQIKRLIRE